MLLLGIKFSLLLFVLLIELLHSGSINRALSLLELVARFVLASACNCTLRVLNLNQVSSEDAIKSFSQSIILTDRLQLSQASSQLILHLKVCLAHFVRHHTDLRCLIDHTFRLLNLPLFVFLLLKLSDLLKRLFGVLDVLADENRDLIVLLLSLALFGSVNLSLVPLLPFFLLIALSDRQLLGAINWLVHLFSVFVFF